MHTTFPSNQADGIAYNAVSANTYRIQLTLFGPGGGGCGTPRFTGFSTEGTAFIANIERAPMTGTCLMTANVTFDIQLDRNTIPGTVKTIEMTEECEIAGCRGSGVSFQP